MESKISDSHTLMLSDKKLKYKTECKIMDL